ncbi:hypothetical protein, partial [Mesomycoplasma ovipneumoniae]|uniref:hypothetical protein n=1 Tax=Mesomycoplasma ovipneumoniae TaxID=29562 RepID=UPI003080DA5E
ISGLRIIRATFAKISTWFCSKPDFGNKMQKINFALESSKFCQPEFPSLKAKIHFLVNANKQKYP